jgi:hypothetical protein
MCKTPVPKKSLLRSALLGLSSLNRLKFVVSNPSPFVPTTNTSFFGMTHCSFGPDGIDFIDERRHVTSTILEKQLPICHFDQLACRVYSFSTSRELS